jgi:drug/metabolite transporter (DMT)-like permease
MSFPVMVAVLCAALLHAFWNFLVKSTEDKHLSMTAVVIGHAPFALITLVVMPLPSIDSLPYLLTGTMLHVGYQLFLLASYRIGDLSQVYPLARGVAPLIVAGISVLLLGVPFSMTELYAIVIIGTGIMSLTLVRRSDGQRNGRAALLAIITGTFIAAYSLVDGLGAREAGTALGFYSWLSMLNVMVFAIIMNIARPGIVRKVVHRHWRLTMGAGTASFIAYGIVIWAFTQAPIALVTALRETSIIFALFLGVFFLKERLDLMKVVAAMLTMLGVGLLRLQQ